MFVCGRPALCREPLPSPNFMLFCRSCCNYLFAVCSTAFSHSFSAKLHLAQKNAPVCPKTSKFKPALTSRSGNSSRLAPCCWPMYPVNPVRIPAGSTIHSRFLETPFQPRQPAYAAPSTTGICSVCCAFAGETLQTMDVRLQPGRLQAETVKVRGGSLLHTTTWIQNQVNRAGSQTKKASTCRRNLLNPCAWISKNERDFLSVLFQRQSHDFSINISLAVGFFFSSPKQYSWA